MPLLILFLIGFRLNKIEAKNSLKLQCAATIKVTGVKQSNLY